MRPPMCAVCDKDFYGDEGGLIYFNKRPSDIAWDKKMEEEGMIGHPPYADWFCGIHYDDAKKLQDLTISEAMKIIKSK